MSLEEVVDQLENAQVWNEETQKVSSIDESVVDDDDDEYIELNAKDEKEPDPFLTSFASEKVTALEYMNQVKTLTTGCPLLDKELNGGIAGFGLTEIVGESGNGKTQICLQLALTAQLPKEIGGLESGVVYINTESAFPSKRLNELVKHFKRRFPNRLPKDPMSGIILEHVADRQSLSICLNVRLPAVIKERKIGLIILDSIAAIFRSEYTSLLERAEGIREVGFALHSIAGRNQITLVVVNQVTGSVKLEGSVPSLGKTWTNFVTTRLHLYRTGDKRAISVPFSPHIKQKIIPFELGPGGVRGPSK